MTVTTALYFRKMCMDASRGKLMTTFLIVTLLIISEKPSGGDVIREDVNTERSSSDETPNSPVSHNASLSTAESMTSEETTEMSPPTQSTAQTMPMTKAKRNIDLCNEHGRIVCGQAVPCRTDSDINAVYCVCDSDKVFDADARRCIHKDSCKLNPCPIGDCSDNNGASGRTCHCRHSKYGFGFNDDCSVKKDYEEYCEEDGAKPVVVGLQVECACEDYQSMTPKGCAYTYCSNFRYSCKELCESGALGKDDRCCQGWNTNDCTAEPERSGYCNPGYFLDPTTGSCIDVCTANNASEVCSHGCSKHSDPSTPFACMCNSGETLQDDGITCKPQGGCTPTQVTACEQRGGQVCILKGKKPECKCPDDQIMESGKCVGSCSREKEEECTAPFAYCKIFSNTENCACVHPMIWNDPEKQCELRVVTYIARFKLAPPTLSTYSTNMCKSEEEIEKAMLMLYGGSNLVASNLVSCTDEYVVQLVFGNPIGDPVVRRILLCEHERNDTCFFPPSLRVLRGSASVHPENMCDKALTGFLSMFPNHHSCSKRPDGTYSLTCTDSYRKVTKEPLKNLHVDICVGKACNETCTQPGKECVNEHCVCRFDHIQQADGSCVEACNPNPCQNGGECTSTEWSKYICRCPPEYVGPLCEDENEHLRSARLVIIIISVLVSLLVVCLVGIVIVCVWRRRQRRAAENSERQRRDLSKLQHCYDGIQRASAVPEEENTVM